MKGEFCYNCKKFLKFSLTEKPCNRCLVVTRKFGENYFEPTKNYLDSLKQFTDNVIPMNDIKIHSIINNKKGLV